jgi:hypothetical protein
MLCKCCEFGIISPPVSNCKLYNPSTACPADAAEIVITAVDAVKAYYADPGRLSTNVVASIGSKWLEEAMNNLRLALIAGGHLHLPMPTDEVDDND